VRRPRSILYDDDPDVLGVLALLFERRGYDVIALAQATPCAVYDDCALGDGERACADIMVTDLEMPGMDGITLLETQLRHGCPLTIRNKAVISGSLDAAALEDIRRLGCAWFRKPFRLAQFEEWILECESRMDLRRPLGVPRKEPRESCEPGRVITVGLGGDECVAEVINRSSSGVCLRIERQLAVAQVLEVRGRAVPPGRVVVRWTKADDAGGYLAGAACA
jgi:CheY-like chemotaxis protein